ncbi:uncharacterized protein LOC118267315 [Spodoptera frugiperda]|uniref:Uncharacterized protein LOC118267315 n=1 Tax=Spodoptera frugiperda TaxID=7108 RepID=A0A9R0D229_SPOFR|nr:uncharacterized protein LOC118267315 [Spodoptera frugiperda]
MSKSQDYSSYKVTTYSRYNISESTSDIQVFVNEFRERIENDLRRNEDHAKIPFSSFAQKRLSISDIAWLQDNTERFFKDTENKTLIEDHYLSECGFICSMVYAPDGETIIVGHSTGMVQMRHGSTGTVLCTLRNIQFPPKPVHALEYSPFEPNVCYAACIDGAVYRIEIPQIDTSIEDPPGFCIKADPMVESLNMQFYGSPGTSLYATPFVTQRCAALSVGVLAECQKMAVGYSDTSIKIYNMETQEADATYKVHKLRLQFIPKKLQRMHYGQVVALRAHPHKPFLFASGAWDKTLRIWDIRCQVGCVMTFEGVDICSDAIDLNREHLIAGSWMPTDGVSVWDLAARKLISFVKVQNRRPDVDGEYVYACRYWRSYDYNRKGKYALVGGSGTNSLEVINLHNRYITCSYPCQGTILAVSSYQERIAFAGTSSAFTIVSFYDPKLQNEKYEAAVEPEYDYTKPTAGAITLYRDDESMHSSTDQTPDTDMPESPSSTETDTPKTS